jgi:hypothetical protein
MATESSLNPVPLLIHLLAIAAGIFFGLRAMDAIAPDLPEEGVEPGIASSSAPGSVAGNDPNSLFLAANLAPALDQLSDQLPAGEGVGRLRIEPGSLSAETRAGEGLFELGDVSPSLPALLGSSIHKQRDPVTLEDIGYMELVATREGPEWYVQLDINRTDVPPPWTYGAPLDGAPLTVGGAPPKPVTEAAGEPEP